MADPDVGYMDFVDLLCGVVGLNSPSLNSFPTLGVWRVSMAVLLR